MYTRQTFYVDENIEDIIFVVRGWRVGCRAGHVAGQAACAADSTALPRVGG